MKIAKEKWVKIGRGFPRKYTHNIQKQWFTGHLDTKKTSELLARLYKKKVQKVTWSLLPNKFKDKPGEPPYYLSIGYWGVEDVES